MEDPCLHGYNECHLLTYGGEDLLYCYKPGLIPLQNFPLGFPDHHPLNFALPAVLSTATPSLCPLCLNFFSFKRDDRFSCCPGSVKMFLLISLQVVILAYWFPFALKKHNCNKTPTASLARNATYKICICKYMYMYICSF